VSSHARSASVGQWMVKADTQPSRAPARPGLGVLRHTWGTKQHQEAPRALLGASGRRAGHAHLPCRTGQDSAAAGPATGRFTWQKAGFACCMLGRRWPPVPGRPGRSTHSTQQQVGGCARCLAAGWAAAAAAEPAHLSEQHLAIGRGCSSRPSRCVAAAAATAVLSCAGVPLCGPQPPAADLAEQILQQAPVFGHHNRWARWQEAAVPPGGAVGRQQALRQHAGARWASSAQQMRGCRGAGAAPAVSLHCQKQQQLC
jgi:hypothetical protein